MAYYDTFMSITKPLNEQWKDSLQELVDMEFENSSTYTDRLEEEITFGSFKFRKIRARVTSLIDSKTGQRVNDDYKKIIYPNIDYKAKLGTRYKLDNNIWIVSSTDVLSAQTSSVYIKRCNNTLNTQNEFGELHQEPCYIDYKVTETQIFRNDKLDVPSGRIFVQCQLNEYTKKIKNDDRFIFGEDVYKVRERSKFDQSETMNRNSAYLLSFYCDLDADNLAEDNKELGIANYKKYKFSIDCDSALSNIMGYTSNVNAILNATVEGKPYDVVAKLKYESTNPTIATIDSETGDYRFNTVGKCEFIITSSDIPSLRHIISVDVVSFVKDNYEVIVKPNTTYIPLNETINYTIFEYNNDTKLNTIFDIYIDTDLTKIPNRNYIFNKNENGFKITNLKLSNYPVVVKYKNLRTNEIASLNIELGGL